MKFSTDINESLNMFISVTLIMSSLKVTIIALLGVMQSAVKVSTTGVTLMVRPGSNVTLYGDCTWTFGSLIFWYRNCSHYRQPSFVISTNNFKLETCNPSLSCYQSEWNSTSQSHDLLIKNITESELGVYYCSVAKPTVVDETVIQQKLLHSFGNITYRLSFGGVQSNGPHQPTFTPDVPTLTPSSPPPNSTDDQCWSQLAIWCPVCALLSALICSTCVYCLCHSKTGRVECGECSKKRESRKGKQGEDRELCYASLDVPTRAHTAKSKKKRTQTQNTDFSTYSEVKTHRI